MGCCQSDTRDMTGDQENTIERQVFQPFNESPAVEKEKLNLEGQYYQKLDQSK
jgi:hypothetical protein